MHDNYPHYVEWLVAGCVIVAMMCALLGLIPVATLILALVSLTTSVIRLIMRERSPWKIRSVAFDTTVGMMLAVSVLVGYVSILILH